MVPEMLGKRLALSTLTAASVDALTVAADGDRR
jgi:hypothetical protein